MAFAAITVEGGLFPSDLLDRLATGGAPDQQASDFGLSSGQRMSDEIQSAFSDARSYWDAFQRRLAHSTASPTTVTREAVVIPLLERLGFTLVFQRSAVSAGGDSYTISHRAGDDQDAPPVHVVAIDQSLDRRIENARRSPHATVQEYLNRSDALWGLATNGRTIRLLRDSARQSRPTYVEFDLRAIVEDNLYSEFVLLYRLLHRTRFPEGGADANACALEGYYQTGLDEGGRVREHLRDGVEEALRQLGTAFLVHPESGDLRAALQSGQLDVAAYYQQLLRLVYRLLFLLVVEERKTLFSEGVEDVDRQEIYSRYYSISRLRERAERYVADDRYSDLWQGVLQTFMLFRDDEAAQHMGMRALGGQLFGANSCADLEGAACENSLLLGAMFQFTRFHDGRVRRRVNFAGLDVEELGSVYESLLDYHPQIILEPVPRFDLIPGSERKQTGSYYTPPSLVRELIESALVPVMEERLQSAATVAEKESALLDLRVVDPASGSGHFLLAAARRIARELARVQSGEAEPAPEAYRTALRDVIRSCIYAVDKNPLAVDLCKVALWIEGYNAGLPLSFLDNHIKLGDSLVGVFDIDVLAEGIPDEAYAAVTGDDKKLASDFKKRNKREREGQLSIFGAPAPDTSELAGSFRRLGLQEERTTYDVHQKEEAYRKLRRGGDWLDLKAACDLWTYAFFAPLRRGEGDEDAIPTSNTVRSYLRQPGAGHGRLVGAAVALSEEHPFFHWPLEFPDVFARGGFDVVLGNPPWDQLQLDPQEYFAVIAPTISKAQHTAARNRAIEHLATSDPSAHSAYREEERRMESVQKFVHSSRRFPLTNFGRLNTAPLFAELDRQLQHRSGRAGIVVPSGIATDSFNQYFFANLIDTRNLASLYDFENRENIFPGIGHGRFRFCLLTLTGVARPASQGAEFAFFLHNAEQLRDVDRRFTLSAEDIALFNPNTRTCPIFRTRRDAELTSAIYRRVPVMVDESKGTDGNPWGFQGLLMFMMNTSSHLFRTRQELEGDGWRLQSNVFLRDDARCLPLYEAKFLWHFDHRLGSYSNFDDRPENTHLPPLTPSQHNDPSHLVIPWYWVPEAEVEARLQGRWDRPWLLGWRDITNSTNERTVIATVLPRVGVGNNAPIMMLPERTASRAACLVASLSAFALDFAARFKVGGTHLNFFIANQLPVLPPSSYDQPAPWASGEALADWVSSRVLELVYTAWDMQSFACDLGYEGPPFPWDEERRFFLRCELDAAFFHQYGIARENVDYIMETFPIVKRKDETRFGEYRTKRTILEIYDAMQCSVASGVPYQGETYSAISEIARAETGRA